MTKTTSQQGWHHFFHANRCIPKETKWQHHHISYGRMRSNLKTETAPCERTDLHSAFDQIKGNNSCVRGATAHNPTKATQDEILLRAELTTVPLWRNTVETLRTGHCWALTFEEFSWIKHLGLKYKQPDWKLYERLGFFLNTILPVSC